MGLFDRETWLFINSFTPLIALTVSFLALILSAVSAIKTWRTNSLQSKHQERLVNLETAREQDRQRLAQSAEVSALIDRGERPFMNGTVKRYWLVIRNDGRALARNVRVLLDGKPFIEHALVPDGEEEIMTIGSGIEHRYNLAVSQKSERVAHVLIQWDDDSGEPRRWESKLQIVRRGLSWLDDDEL